MRPGQRSNVIYSIAASLVAFVHLAFIIFVVLGGLLNLFWRRAWALHLPALAWGVLVEVAGLACPLTSLENYFRSAAGGHGYSGGFVDHFLISLIYPALPEWTHPAIGAGLAIFNIALYLILFRNHFFSNGGRTYDSRG